MSELDVLLCIIARIEKNIAFVLRMCYGFRKADFLVLFYFNSIFQKIHAFQHTTQLKDFLRGIERVLKVYLLRFFSCNKQERRREWENLMKRHTVICR